MIRIHRNILFFLALEFLSSMVTASEPKKTSLSASDKRPNFLFVLTDDQRKDTLGCYGNRIMKTPNLDRLASEGTLFENAFVTSAICTPSRACYFLGQYERCHGVNFNSGTALSPEAWQNGYPLQMRKAGYYTGYIGKSHVPIGTQGFFSGLSESSFDFWYAAHEFLSFYPKVPHPIFRQAQADTQIEVLQEGALSFVNSPESFIAGAKSFLQARPSNQPFCLTIALNLPHCYGVTTMQQKPTDPELYRTGYIEQRDLIPLPATYVAKDDIQKQKIPKGVFYPEFRQSIYDFVNTPETMRTFKMQQYQTITGIDQMIGKLRLALEKAGLAENTIIVFTSDHGTMEGEFGLGGKALNYEPTLRVPMIVMDPRLPASQRGRRESRFALSIDVAPTLLEWSGIAIPNSMQGRSLIPLIQGVECDWRSLAFAENLWATEVGNPRCESIRNKVWKYTRYFANDRTIVPAGVNVAGVTPREAAAYRRWLTSSIRGEPPDYEELFSLDVDPDETSNLAGDAQYSATLAQLRSDLDREIRIAKGRLDEDPMTVPLDAAEQLTLRAKARTEARANANKVTIP